VNSSTFASRIWKIWTKIRTPEGVLLGRLVIIMKIVTADEEHLLKGSEIAYSSKSGRFRPNPSTFVLCAKFASTKIRTPERVLFGTLIIMKSITVDEEHILKVRVLDHFWWNVLWAPHCPKQIRNVKNQFFRVSFR